MYDFPHSHTERPTYVVRESLCKIEEKHTRCQTQMSTCFLKELLVQTICLSVSVTVLVQRTAMRTHLKGISACIEGR